MNQPKDKTDQLTEELFEKWRSDYAKLARMKLPIEDLSSIMAIAIGNLLGLFVNTAIKIEHHNKVIEKIVNEAKGAIKLNDRRILN